MKLAMFVGLFLLIAAPAIAAPEDTANQVASEIMSPFCEGVTLHDCPSQAALDLREQIEGWARAGWSKARIMDELEDRYGARIHALPQTSSGLAAWILPIAAAVAGFSFIALIAMKWSSGRTKTPRATVDAADRARIERELATMREEMP